MAEDDSSQEKTEEPTSRRLEKSREDGQVPRSKELTTSAVLLGGSFGLLIFGDHIAEKIFNIAQYNFSLSRELLYDPRLMFAHMKMSVMEALWALAPLFSVLALAAFFGPISLGGWLFSTKALAPKADRISPLAGLKRMFSAKSLVELLKAWAKVLVIASVSVVLLNYYQEELFSISKESMRPAIIHSVTIFIWAVIGLSASTLLIALVDIPFQIHEHTKKLKMTLQQVKDEHKDTEGKPEVKGRIRQLQMEMSQRRMMSNIPDADVVITNPTHFAVALKYDVDSMGAPILLAKGADNMAFKIREIAGAHNIPILESPALARAVYFNTEVDTEIPEGLFLAIAQVLAYVYQLDRYAKGLGDKPGTMPDFPVPDDLKQE